MSLQKSPLGILIRPDRASKCGPFARSFGLSEKIDGPDGANGRNEIRRKDEWGKVACKPFSEVLIVRAIRWFYPLYSVP